MNSSNRFLLAISICLLVGCSALATSNSHGLFQGVFTGTAIGYRDTSAPLTINLTQDNNTVTGIAAVGDGLKVDTGGFVCPGLVKVPSGTIDVAGDVSSQDPQHLEAKSGLSASGLTITAEVIAELSQDSSTMDAELKLNIPWPCRNTTIKATLMRSS